jgi:hypothetical protein
MHQLLAMMQRDAAEAWERRASLWLQMGLSWLLPTALWVWSQSWGASGDEGARRGALALGLVVMDALWTASILWSRAIHRAQVWGELEILLSSGVGLGRLLLITPAFSAACSLARCAVYLLLMWGLYGASFETSQLHGALLFLLLAGFALGAVGVMSMCLTLLMRSPEPLGPTLWGASLLLCGALSPQGAPTGWAGELGAALPAGALLEGLRGALLRGQSAGAQWEALVRLGLGTAALLAVAWVVVRHTRALLMREGVHGEH